LESRNHTEFNLRPSPKAVNRQWSRTPPAPRQTWQARHTRRGRTRGCDHRQRPLACPWRARRCSRPAGAAAACRAPPGRSRASAARGACSPRPRTRSHGERRASTSGNRSSASPRSSCINAHRSGEVISTSVTTGMTVAIAVLAWLIDLEPVVGVLHQRYPQPPPDEARYELLDQGCLATARPPANPKILMRNCHTMNSKKLEQFMVNLTCFEVN